MSLRSKARITPVEVRSSDVRADLSDRRVWPVPIPSDNYVFFGCRPLVPFHGVPAYDPNVQGPPVSGASSAAPFHAPGIAPGAVENRTLQDGSKAVDRPWPRHVCPQCKGETRQGYWAARDGGAHICGWCDMMGEPFDANADRQRALFEARLESDAAERAVHEDAITVTAEKVVLSELERRRIWNGYVKGSRAKNLPLDKIRNRTLVSSARRWLREIDQKPDFRLKLDHNGNAIRDAESPEAIDEAIDAA